VKHPTIDVPDVGAMDHAWDVLGEWRVALGAAGSRTAGAGRLRVRSWTEADLELEPRAAADTGLRPRVTLERASRVQATDAGGGALQWVFVTPDDGWTVQATLWPGALCLFFHGPAAPEGPPLNALASRDRAYYLRKYPFVAR
jgi:hypothetical protein